MKKKTKKKLIFITSICGTKNETPFKILLNCKNLCFDVFKKLEMTLLEIKNEFCNICFRRKL